MQQWLSGTSDADIPEALANFRASKVAYSFCACLRPVCYCPPGFHRDPSIEASLTRMCDGCGTTSKRSALICASWWFISVEVVAFVTLTSCTAMEALTKGF